MKKHLLTAAVATALALGAVTAQAIPTLQLTILGGNYTDSTTYASDPVFTLVALLYPEGEKGNPNSDPASLSDTFYISAAVYPKEDTGGTFGSFKFDALTINVTGDMDYGTPPLDPIYDAIYGDLPSHSVFETYFSEIGFTFDPNNAVAPSNVALSTPTSLGDFGACDPTDPSEKCMYYATFALDLTALSSDIGIHFDLYNQDVEEVCERDPDTHKKVCWDVASIRDFAPFSHDAQGSSTSTGFITSNGTAPEPGTLTLFGIGILGGLFAHRRRRQMRA